jgi:hypothetical protein
MTWFIIGMFDLTHYICIYLLVKYYISIAIYKCILTAILKASNICNRLYYYILRRLTTATTTTTSTSTTTSRFMHVVGLGQTSFQHPKHSLLVIGGYIRCANNINACTVSMGLDALIA